MTGTQFAFPRIRYTMEILMLLFLLAFLDRNPKFKDSLQGALKFYRENRELLMAFADSPAASTEPSPTKPAEADKIRILEHFLNRQ